MRKYFMTTNPQFLNKIKNSGVLPVQLLIMHVIIIDITVYYYINGCKSM